MMLTEPNLSKINENQRAFKSILHLKRQAYYKQKSHLFKQKKFRELRFIALSNEILNPDNIEKYNKNQYLSAIELRNRIHELMQTKNILGLAMTIQKIYESFVNHKIIQVFDQSLIQGFIKFSSNLLFHAQIAFIYMRLSSVHISFRQSILKRPQITNEIFKQLFRLKDMKLKKFYIQILTETILRDIQINKQQCILDYFQKFYALTKQQIIDQQFGAFILSQLCYKMKKKKLFISNQIIQFILKIYKNQIEKYKGRNIKTLYDCEIIIGFLFILQSNIEIKFYFQSLKLFVSLRKQLIKCNKSFEKNKDYFYSSIQGIIINTKQAQRMLLYEQRSELKKYLKTQNPLISQLRLNTTQYPLTTIICDYILRQNKFILQQKQYKTSYIQLLNTLIQIMDQKSIGQYLLRQICLNDVIEAGIKKIHINMNNHNNPDQ